MMWVGTWSASDRTGNLARLSPTTAQTFHIRGEKFRGIAAFMFRLDTRSIASPRKIRETVARALADYMKRGSERIHGSPFSPVSAIDRRLSPWLNFVEFCGIGSKEGRGKVEETGARTRVKENRRETGNYLRFGPKVSRK